MLIHANEVMLNYISIGILDTYSMKILSLSFIIIFLPALRQKFRLLVHFGIKSRSKIYSEKPLFSYRNSSFLWSNINWHARTEFRVYQKCIDGNMEFLLRRKGYFFGFG